VTPNRDAAPATPECDKKLEIIHSGQAQLIQDFIEWLLDEQGVQLYSREEYEDGTPVPWYRSREQIMAGFFGIDLDKIEKERRALLAHIRQQEAPQ